MKPLGLDELCSAVHGRWLRPGEQQIAGGATTDTRTAEKGSLFVAIRGERFDGHDFLDQARGAGCVAAVVARDARQLQHAVRQEGMGLIAVADTRRALGQLASYCRDRAGADVVAVTGSNGKTTVARMIHHILSRRLAGSCPPKSYNNEIGLPLTLLGVGEGDDYVVCEIGSNAPGEVEALGRIARPNVAVITSVAPTHLEKFISVERVAAEKASLIGCCVDGGLGVVPADSECLEKVIRFYDKRIVRFGLSDEADLRLTACEQRGAAMRFQLNGRIWVEMPLAGRHNAVNALSAIAVAQRFGFSQEESAEALADFQGAEMRLEWISAGRVTIINDAYNANPASVAAAADVLARADGRRRIIVVGDMLELGEQAEELHLKVGREIAATSNSQGRR
ncbi:MAG: UDP-N-acetylmuramoyl-tripeptide--D-alanyl-D-alanine ligase, partial [Planctomycetota bacterium]